MKPSQFVNNVHPIRVPLVTPTNGTVTNETTDMVKGVAGDMQKNKWLLIGGVAATFFLLKGSKCLLAGAAGAAAGYYGKSYLEQKPTGQ